MSREQLKELVEDFLQNSRKMLVDDAGNVVAQSDVKEWWDSNNKTGGRGFGKFYTMIRKEARKRQRMLRKQQNDYERTRNRW
jgi:hypothetical protein